MLKNQVLFGLIEKNVLLKGNKDYRGGGRCKIRDGCKKWVDLGGDSWGGGEGRSDCFVLVRGSYFRRGEIVTSAT